MVSFSANTLNSTDSNWVWQTQFSHSEHWVGWSSFLENRSHNRPTSRIELRTDAASQSGENLVTATARTPYWRRRKWSTKYITTMQRPVPKKHVMDIHPNCVHKMWGSFSRATFFVPRFLYRSAHQGSRLWQRNKFNCCLATMALFDPTYKCMQM